MRGLPLEAGPGRLSNWVNGGALSSLLLVVFACRGGAEIGPDPLATDGARDTVDTEPAEDTAPPPLGFVVDPGLLGPVDQQVLLMRTVIAETDRPALASWSVDGGRIRQAALARTSHRVPVLGFEPGSTHQLEVTFTPERGDPVTVGWSVTTEPVPALFPILEVVADDPSRRSPGWTLFTAENATTPPKYASILLDEDLRVVWIHHGDARVWAMSVSPAGTLVGLTHGLDGVLELEWSGATVRSIPSPVTPLHHECVPTATGFWSLTFAQHYVADYPKDYAFAESGAATIRDVPVVHLEADGTVGQTYPLVDRLDPQRIGYDALKPTPQGFDWAHANGVAADPVDGGLWVSVRQQDVVAKLDATGDLQWLLGDPAGWGPEFADLLLTPVGELQWPYHQHAPAVGDDGTLWLFDNHNNGATPYTPLPPDPQVSRLVGYHVDPVAGTVAQVASYDQTATGTLFSLALGDADPLPGGTVLGTWGNVHAEQDAMGVLVANIDRGWSERVARIVEIDPQRPGEPAFDLRVRGDNPAGPGWIVYRADRITSPWGEEAQ